MHYFCHSFIMMADDRIRSKAGVGSPLMVRIVDGRRVRYLACGRHWLRFIIQSGHIIRQFITTPGYR